MAKGAKKKTNVRRSTSRKIKSELDTKKKVQPKTIETTCTEVHPTPIKEGTMFNTIMDYASSTGKYAMALGLCALGAILFLGTQGWVMGLTSGFICIGSGTYAISGAIKGVAGLLKKDPAIDQTKATAAA